MSANKFHMLLLAVCIVFGGKQVSAQEFMTQKQLLETIPGATLYGVSSRDGKTKWAQAYSKGGRKGKISGVWGKDKYVAEWYVRGDMFCEKKANQYDDCWAIQRVGEKQLQPYRNGTEKTKRLWYIK